MRGNSRWASCHFGNFLRVSTDSTVRPLGSRSSIPLLRYRLHAGSCSWVCTTISAASWLGKCSRTPHFPIPFLPPAPDRKWKVLILRDLMPGTKRFGELKKSIGHVTQKVLTAQLRQMEESGLSAPFRGLFCVREEAFSENAAKLQKKLQFSHQKRRFPIDSLVIIGV